MIVPTLAHLSLVDPPAAVTNGYLTTLAGPNATTVIATLNGSLVTAGEGRPIMPRNVVITVTHATAVVALSGTITGYADKNRKLNITEDWSVTAGTASKTFTGAKSFAVITSVTIIAATDASANSVIIGTGTVFGIVFDGTPLRVSWPKAVLEMMDAAIVTNGTVVAGSTSATADAYGTYSPSTVPNAAHDYDVLVVSDTPTQ